jgi:predicted nucleic acid-binding protein
VSIVVADTGPINYLILIGHVEILPALFQTVILPSAVRDELAETKAPAPVQAWIAQPPTWIEIRHLAASGNDPMLAALDAGEQAAIAIAAEVNAELILMDDRRGVNAARKRGFRVAGTLAVLGMAARHNLVNLADALDRLKKTSFHYRQELIQQFLSDQGGTA